MCWHRSQSVMPVDGEGLPGKALKERWCLSLFLKAGRVEMDERWPESLFQTLEATDENDLDLVIPVFRVGTHSDNEEEDRNDRVATYRGIRAARQDGCWNWRTLKVIVAMLKIILWRTGSQCNSERTGVMWQKQDYSVTTRVSVFWTSCRRARFETDVPAKRENLQ